MGGVSVLARRLPPLTICILNELLFNLSSTCDLDQSVPHSIIIISNHKMKYKLKFAAEPPYDMNKKIIKPKKT